MPLIQNSLVEKNENYGRTINEVLNLWIKPYFRKKNQEFDMQKFGAALIELFDDCREPKIRLNEEVKIRIEFNCPKITPEDVGKQIYVDLKEIKNLSWSQRGLNENSAKVLVVRFSEDWWFLNFDFRYNQGNAKKKLHRAKEFLSGCNTMLRKKEYVPNVLIYLIWSTAELILDVKFLLHAQKTKSSHYERKKKLEGPLGTAFLSPEFSTLLLTVYSMKNGARYADNDYSDKYCREDLQKQVKILEKELIKIQESLKPRKGIDPAKRDLAKRNKFHLSVTSREGIGEEIMSWDEISQRIDKEIKVGTKVPKTRSGTRPVIKKMDSRIYLRTGVKTQAEKFTTKEMLRYVYNTITRNKFFTAKKLKSKFKKEYKQGTCIFSMTGGILEVLGLARYDHQKHGYILVNDK